MPHYARKQLDHKEVVEVEQGLVVLFPSETTKHTP